MKGNDQIKTMVVGRDFPVRRLRRGIDCYTKLHERLVVIQGCHASYVLIYEPENEESSCNCEQFKEYEDCEHIQALSAGLWAKLCTVDPFESLVTCTLEWCARLYTILQLTPTKAAVSATVW